METERTTSTASTTSSRILSTGPERGTVSEPSPGRRRRARYAAAVRKTRTTRASGSTRTPTPVIAQSAAASPHAARPAAGARPTAVGSQRRRSGIPASSSTARPTPAKATLRAVSRSASLIAGVRARPRRRSPPPRTRPAGSATAYRRPSPPARPGRPSRRSPDRGTRAR